MHWLRLASRESWRAALTAVLFALFARTFVVQAFQIPTPSMEPNLLIGDHVVVDKMIFAGDPAWWLPQRAVRRGDVVVFRAPDDPQRAYVKRCLGLPGDRIEIVNKRLLVNGEPRDEAGYVFHSDPRTYPSAATLPDALRLRDNFGPLTVPPDGLFCLGDNRDNSKDSRFWGTVPRSAVRGRAVLVYWSAEPPPSDGWWAGVRSLSRRARWSRCFQAVR